MWPRVLERIRESDVALDPDAQTRLRDFVEVGEQKLIEGSLQNPRRLRM
jgi:hypothetical protein